jgi:hypothetical protein
MPLQEFKMQYARNGFGRKLIAMLGVAGLATSAALAQPKPAQPAPNQPVPAPAPTPAPKTPDQPKTDEKLPSVDEVMEKSIKATGGAEAWAKAKTSATTGTLKIPSAGIEGKMSTWNGENGKSLNVVTLAGFGEVREGSDGDTVWMIDPNAGPRIVTGDERELRLAIAKMNNPLDWKKLFSKIEVKGVEDVEGKPAYKVVGEIEAGKKQPITQYFDKESGLLTKLELTMSSPEGDVQMEMFPTDYKEVGGVKVAHKTKRMIMKMIEMTEVIEKYEINPEIPADKFALPAEIKELKDAKKDDKPKEEKPKEDKPVTPPPAPAKPEKK